MMKEVYNFNIPIIFLTAIYTVIFLSLLYSLQGKHKIKYSSVLGVTTGFIVFYTFFIINFLFEFKTISPDSIAYSKIIKDFWQNYNTWSIGVQLYSIINYIPIKLSFQNPSLFILFNIFFYFSGITMIGRAFILYLSIYDKSVPKHFFFYLYIIASIYPIGLIIIPTLLREGSMVFFLGFTTYYMVVIYSKKKLSTKYLIYFTISLILLTLIRPIGGITFIGAIFALYFIHKVKHLNVKQFFYLITSVVVFLASIHYMVNLFYNLPFSFNWLSQYRKSHVLLFGNESYGSDLKFQTLGEIIKNSFLLFNQYLFSPLPILIPKEITGNKIIPTLDTLYIILLIIPILIQLKKTYIRKIIFFVGVLIFIPALFETHISGAYRHRMNAILILMPVLVYSLNQFIQGIIKYINLKK
jgi:hypothetical protein